MNPEKPAARLLQEIERLIVAYERIRAGRGKPRKGNRARPLDAVQLSILRWARDGIEQQEVLRRTGLSDGAGSDKMKRLFENAYILSEPMPRNRSRHTLRLKPEGQRTLQRIPALAEEALKKAAPQLARDLSRLESQIQALKDVADALDHAFGDRAGESPASVPDANASEGNSVAEEF